MQILHFSLNILGAKIALLKLYKVQIDSRRGVYPFRAAFEDLNIRIPSDPQLRADLRAIKKETTAAGNIRFSADRGENGHSDRFWAGALAIHARGGNDGPCRLEAAGLPSEVPETGSYAGSRYPDHSDDR